MQCKLSSVQHVKSNRKGIVDAGKKLKTLRAIKDEKKERDKKKDAFFFIHTKASVDNHVHWEQLNCGVITADHDSKENCTILKTLKVQKAKIEGSSSSEEEMFPPNNSNAVDVAAETTFGAASSLMHSPLVEKQLKSEYVDQNVAFVGVECFEEEPLPESNLPDFDVIFKELNKLKSSDELLDLKTRLLQLKESLVDGSVSIVLDNSKDDENNDNEAKTLKMRNKKMNKRYT